MTGGNNKSLPHALPKQSSGCPCKISVFPLTSKIISTLVAKGRLGNCVPTDERGGCLVMKYTEKAELLDAFFASV